MQSETTSDFEPPRLMHDCGRCAYLGRFGAEDLYVCGPPGSVIARFGDDGPDYLSTPIDHMYLYPQLQEAFERASARGIVEPTARERVLCALFAPLGQDVHARHELGSRLKRALLEAFDPAYWDVAEGILSQGGYDFLFEVSMGEDLLAGPALLRALRLGMTDLAEFREVVADANGYLESSEPAVYPHEPECSGAGNPRWARVDTCGPCGRIVRERERAEREALYEEYEALAAEPDSDRAKSIEVRILGGRRFNLEHGIPI